MAKIQEVLNNIKTSFHNKPIHLIHGIHHDRVWIQVGMMRPDCDTGEISIGKGGKVYISEYATEDEIVKKVLGLCLAYVEHEIREEFYYKSKRLFGPHISIDAMMSISDEIVGRIPIKQ